MSTTLKALQSITHWEEIPLEIPEDLSAGAPRLMRMRFDRVYTGDLTGKAVGLYCSNYHNDGGDDPTKATARFGGLTYFSGEIKGVGKGTIVFIDRGTWDPATGAVCEWIADPHSGTGDLAGLKATGGFAGSGFEPYPVTLEIQK